MGNKCPRCGYENPSNATTCLNCGYPLTYSPTLAYLKAALMTLAGALIISSIIFLKNLEISLLVAVLGILIGNVLYTVPLRRTSSTALLMINSTVAGISIIPTIILEYWYFYDVSLELFKLAYVVAVFIAVYIIMSVFANERVLKYKGIMNNELAIILYIVLALAFLSVILFIYPKGFLISLIAIGVVYLILPFRL